jgi:hypothetical protein
MKYFNETYNLFFIIIEEKNLKIYRGIKILLNKIIYSKSLFYQIISYWNWTLKKGFNKMRNKFALNYEKKVITIEKLKSNKIVLSCYKSKKH